MKHATPTVVLLAALLTFAAAACNPATPAATPEAPAAPAGSAAAGSAAAPAAPAADDANYTVKATAGELTQGAPGALTLTIHPKPGFKINQEYPWKLTVTGDAVIEPSAAELPRDKWTLNDKSGAVEVPVQVKAAGAGKATGSVTFSVCNDSACDVIRDHAVAWEVTAR